MFLRMYFVVRALFNYSVYSDAYSRNICKNHDFYPGFRFICKSSLSNNPETTVFSMFFFFTLVLAFILRVCEISYTYTLSPDGSFNTISMFGQTFLTQVYVIIITMTTVGYGDYSPDTDLGKVVCCFVALFGAFMVGLVVLIVSKAFELRKD